VKEHLTGFLWLYVVLNYVFIQLLIQSFK